MSTITPGFFVPGLTPQTAPRQDDASAPPVRDPNHLSHPDEETSADPTQKNADRVANSQELSENEKKEVEKLKQIDREVRAHEQAHKSALGSYGGAIQLEFTRGPDGRRYATAGQVPVDMSPEDTPAKTVQKAQTIRRAALAPAEPSSADRQVAAQAAQMEAQARAEQLRKKQQHPEDDGSSTSADATATRLQDRYQLTPFDAGTEPTLNLFA